MVRNIVTRVTYITGTKRGREREISYMLRVKKEIEYTERETGEAKGVRARD